MRRVSITLILTTILVFSVVALAQKVQRVRFAKGKSTAVLKGAVIRATKDRYILGARGGQTMRVRISSLEDNAVFYITAPDGSELNGAADEDDAMDWQGELPANGDYSIHVSPSRGNATYTLEVGIR